MQTLTFREPSRVSGMSLFPPRTIKRQMLHSANTSDKILLSRSEPQSYKSQLRRRMLLQLAPWVIVSLSGIIPLHKELLLPVFEWQTARWDVRDAVEGLRDRTLLWPLPAWTQHVLRKAHPSTTYLVCKSCQDWTWNIIEELWSSRTRFQASGQFWWSQLLATVSLSRLVQDVFGWN